MKMEELRNYIHFINSNNSDEPEKISDKLYQLLSETAIVDLGVFKEQILPDLYSLISQNKVKKDLVYLSLLSNVNNVALIQYCVDFEKSFVVLNLGNPATIFDYSICHHRHWLLEVIENEKIAEKASFSNEINILRLINISNHKIIDLDQIEAYLNKVQVADNTFIEFYVTELKQILNAVNLCLKYSVNEENNVSEIYYYSSNHSLLETFSKFIDFKSPAACGKVSDILSKVQIGDSEQFAAFLILLNILNCLNLCKTISNNDETVDSNDAISEIVKENQLHLINLKNLKLQVETLENIFAFLFLQQEHFNDKNKINSSTSLNKGSQFYCSENEVRLILMFLKSCCDEIKNKNPYKKVSEEFRRFTEINKYLADGLWRLELLTNSSSTRNKIRNDVITYMLGSPEGLIHLCLKEDDMQKAHQVIKIFNLENSDAATQIRYDVKLSKFKQLLKKITKMRQIDKDYSTMQSTTTKQTLHALIEEFFKSNHAVETELEEDLIPSSEYMTTYQNEDVNKFLNVLDLALTQGNCFEDSKELLDVVEIYKPHFESESTYLTFFKIIFEIFDETNHEHSISVPEILCNCQYDFDTNKYKSKEIFHNELCNIFDLFKKQLSIQQNGKFNSKHIAHKTFLKLQEICGIFPVKVKEQIKYLRRLLNYLKGFAKMFYIEQDNSSIVSNGKNTSYFELFNFTCSEILEKLLFEKKLDLYDFEQVFSKLKLDLIHHVAAIFFPKIYLHRNQEVEQTKLEKPKFQPNACIISYIQKRNWLLAFILSEMYKTEETKLELNEIRINTFMNLLKLPRVQNLQSLFHENEVITVLHEQISYDLIKKHFDDHIVRSDLEDVTLHISNSQVSTGSLETAVEICEGDLKYTNWKYLFDLIDSVSQSQLVKNEKLSDMRDMVLNELVGECLEPEYYKYIRFISDDKLRRNCILSNLTSWPGDFCIDVIKSELSRVSRVDDDSKEQFMNWCEKIELCEGIKNAFQKTSWTEVFLLCKEKPQEILSNLLNTVEIDLLLKFIKICEVTKESLEIVNESYFLALFDSNIDIENIHNLLDALPEKQSYQTCCGLLQVLRKLDYLNFIANYISTSNLHNSDDNVFKNIRISLKILSCFSLFEQEQLWCLIMEPASIIEVLIMNAKLEKLGQILDIVRNDMENDEYDDDEFSIEKIDEMLRKYAEKSLEFRVILQPDNKSSKSPESSKLLQSLDSVNFILGRRHFIMPEMVPNKSDWVLNDEVTECMCCMETAFSMFNRRHHCRRCGRVICGACSLKRMQVPTYGTIRVRVCLDCYEQSFHDSTGTSSSKSEASTRSIGLDYWLLTDDPMHNQIVREEFSFEYAPSVSLCLAILKHHSKNEEYPKFLLAQCDGMLHLLHPSNSDAMQEIDYLLVIKMLKSLAIAAKMLSAQCMLQWGTSLADRILSQADLLGLLAERGCLHLIPSCGHVQGRYINAATLRRLRDKLLERELWNLALEVSTKAGLDNTGVFAAWGKSYLKAGSLQLAREKFQRCFDKTAHYDTSTELSDSFSSIHLSHLRLKHLSLPENRPIKNPPLLDEIIQILESNTCVIDPKILKDVKAAKPLTSSSWSLNSSINLPLQSDPAICILNKLKNLSNIVVGNYSVISDINDSIKSVNVNKPHLELIFYEESVYYLSKYGTHMSLLEFYIKHDNIEECLRHMLNNRLNSDIFIEIYMLCLRENRVMVLQENMSKIDSTMDVWKDYLKNICRHLEKQAKLHSLYQLQQFMGDFVRAAMTCIKFYKDGVVTYSELTSRVDYLHKAQQHLQQELEQEQWVEVASVRKTSEDSQESYEAKGIVNPSLVMKMDSRNVDKHINTIWRQIEIAKFLAECENAGTPVLEILPEILPYIYEDLSPEDVNNMQIPTLFGTYYERVQLAVLVIVCGKSVEDGFGITFRIIHEHKLNPVKVYCQAGKLLAQAEKYPAIAQLVTCIRSSGVSDTAVTDMCDEMLILAIQTLTKANITGPDLDGLIKLVTNRTAKISAYIETKQLKSAYLLAVKHRRIGDIRRILREAEFLNQPNIIALCQKFLHVHSHSPSHTKETKD